MATEIVKDVHKLQAAITDMNALAQDGFSEIASIARLAAKSLETPEGYRNWDDVAHAFKTIWCEALEIKDYINNEAEGVGCNHVNAAERRRWAALREAREKGIAA